MEPFVRRFVKASVVWLGIGVVLGVAMALAPVTVIYRPAHMHANLLGFVSMMIFGVAYHVMPRFAGRPLHSRLAAGLHYWIANAGLALLVGGWLLRPSAFDAGALALQAGALLSAAGAFLFIYNIWNTVGPAVPAMAPLEARTTTARSYSGKGA